MLSHWSLDKYALQSLRGVLTEGDRDGAHLKTWGGCPVQAPTGVSKFDPVAAAVRAEAPAVRSRSDPLGVLLDYFQGRSSAKVRVDAAIYHICNS